MAIEFIPKPVSRKINIADYAFYSAIVLILAAVSLFLISLYAIKMANKTIDELKAGLVQEKTAERQDLERKIIAYQQKIGDFAKIINAHYLPSKLFTNIEDLTHPKLYFTNIAFSAKEMTVKFSGQTDNFESLGQQILVLKSYPMIKSYSLLAAGLGKDEGIAFVLDVIFDPKILK